MRVLPSLHCFLLVLVAFILRFIKTFLITVVARDGVVYAGQTEAFLQGDWSRGLSAYYPPVYAFISALFALFIGPHYGALAVSVIAGALLILPFHYYGKNFLSSKALFYSSLLLLITPSLVTISGEILAESLYLLVFMTIILALFEQQKQRALRLSALIGTFAGVLTLIRPEGIVIVLGVAALCSRRGKNESGRSMAQRASCLVLALIAGLLVIAPYSYYLKQESGRWTFTKKEGTLIGGVAKYSESQKVTVPEVHAHFKSENDALKEATVARSSSKDLSDLLKSRPILFLKKSARGFGQCLLLIPRVSHWLLFLLACPGLYLLGKSRSWPWELTVLLGLHILVISMVTPQKRYLLPFVLLVTMGAGHSLALISERVESLHKGAMVVVLATLMMILGISAMKVERRRKSVVYELARTLKDESRSSKKAIRVASMDSRVAYYAGMPDRQLPRFHSFVELRRFLVREKISHLCFRKNWQERWCPWMKIDDVGAIVGAGQEGRTELLLIRVQFKD